ncbi:hypothetical protein T4E_5572 [Trichinella pseudospiralis]|uniref:Uncharacterized protein n=1 Tax=Trichinella pseudospiralis TaxID=6337 RepID=A0A0V0Y4Y8_TRIPS|nr:hypothetical protein T4E_5572 [Trichinella pseudospiralis]
MFQFGHSDFWQMERRPCCAAVVSRLSALSLYLSVCLTVLCLFAAAAAAAGLYAAASVNKPLL